MHAVSTNFAKRQNDVILWRHKQRMSSYFDHHTQLHCSMLEFIRGKYNHAVVPGITRPLHATDVIEKMSLKIFQVIWQPYSNNTFLLLEPSSMPDIFAVMNCSVLALRAVFCSGILTWSAD